MGNEIWLSWAEDRGYRVAFGSTRLLDTVRDWMEQVQSQIGLDPAFGRQYLNGFTYMDGIGLEAPAALVMVAVPRPAHVLRYETRGESGRAIIPPTYGEYRPTFTRVRDDAQAAVGGGRYRIEVVSAPLKSLAVLTGLAEYGRNNVVYVPGLGSYVQLVGLVTDMPLSVQAPAEKIQDRLMRRCDGCKACRSACPTGAIGKDRILLRAERCYTLASELPGALPPGQLPPSPDCLIGCLKCQTSCFVNRGRLRYEEAPFALTEEETAFLLGDPPADAVGWGPIREKFERFRLTEDVVVQARNFRRLVGLGRWRQPASPALERGRPRPHGSARQT